MKFVDLLDEYLEMKNTGPDELNGYSDKTYYNRVSWLRDSMNALAPGEIEDVDFLNRS
jgi:hypothetical protein